MLTIWRQDDYWRIMGHGWLSGVYLMHRSLSVILRDLPLASWMIFKANVLGWPI